VTVPAPGVLRAEIDRRLADCDARGIRRGGKRTLLLCPSECDENCTAICHESHQVDYKREHDVVTCPGVVGDDVVRECAYLSAFHAIIDEHKSYVVAEHHVSPGTYCLYDDHTWPCHPYAAVAAALTREES